ncbi:alpha/beta hydrolase [Pseudoponticoccus marisrubri]|uniref:Alpha/beta hydrolase fold-3 domain-containing protein n=1 Tax=Pseudoponticoccus marisrubri TaxID=1685382 RepID=A0A0W7WLT1_9RHOB|nr:alpha/beta hydrolase [Pseudoponticoccus marisrubri]KUF11545.1 hypothetical protein AVJ23_07235 [Pseudoponticoccus marisrubri]
MSGLAEGMREAMQVAEGFADPDAAADFWAVGSVDAETCNLVYPGADGVDRAARLYRRAKFRERNLQIPSTEFVPAEGALLLFIHGGGWTGGSIALNERACRALAVQSGATVISLSYRLAPAHPFPAALEDIRAGLHWLLRGGAGVAAGRIALAGASAGGNLALATALSAPEVPLAALLLFYPVTDDDFDSDSYRRHAEGFGLTRARMQALFAAYDPGGRHRQDPRVVPLRGDLSRLPPVGLFAAERDVLADDSRKLAAALAAAGVPHHLHVEPGVTHGFINRGRLIPAADACLSRAARWLAQTLQTESVS